MHIQTILQNIANYYGVDHEDVIKSPRGTRTLIKVRDIYFWVLSRLGQSHQEIAQIGKRDRSSVTHSLIRTKRALKEDDLFRKEVLYFLSQVQEDRVRL